MAFGESVGLGRSFMAFGEREKESVGLGRSFMAFGERERERWPWKVVHGLWSGFFSLIEAVMVWVPSVPL